MASRPSLAIRPYASEVIYVHGTKTRTVEGDPEAIKNQGSYYHLCVDWVGESST